MGAPGAQTRIVHEHRALGRPRQARTSQPAAAAAWPAPARGRRCSNAAHAPPQRRLRALCALGNSADSQPEPLAPPLAPPPAGSPAAGSKLMRRLPHSTADSTAAAAEPAAAESAAATVTAVVEARDAARQQQQQQQQQQQPAAPAAGGEAADGATPWYGVVALAALAALICSIDRAAISVAILPMAEDFGWSDTVKGQVNAFFYAGYTLTNLVGGYLAATVGSKRTLGAGVLVWSAFTMLTPAAAATSGLPLLLATRFSMGAGEGTAYPCIQDVVKGWVPRDARSRALTLIYSGGQLGTILALLTAPVIIDRAGWPAVFLLYGGLGFLWVGAWQFVDETPPLYGGRQQQAPSSAVKGALGDSSGGGEGMTNPAPLPGLLELPWRSFLTNRAFIGAMAAHTAFGVGHYIMLSWLPSFYFSAFDLDVTASATLSVLPWLATVVVSSSSGVLADWLMNRGHLSSTNTRKLLQVAGSVGPAVCLLALADADDGSLGLGQALALLTGGIALGGFQSAGFAANHQDLAGRYAPLLFGVTNALSSLAGSASVYATGALLDQGHSWAMVFNLVAGVYLAGAAAFALLGSGERQFE